MNTTARALSAENIILDASMAGAGGDLDFDHGPSTSIATRGPPEWRRGAVDLTIGLS